MLRNVFLKSLRDHGKSLLWWAVGLGCYVLFCMAFYPSSVASADQLNAYLDIMPEAFMAAFMGELTDITSPGGFLSGYLFALLAPMLFLFFTIGIGSDAIAGEEDRGTLDLLLANPVSRTSVLLHKFAMLVVATATLAAVYWLTMAAGAYAVGMAVSYWGLLAVTVSTFLLAVCLGAIALAVAAASGSKGMGTGIAAVVAFAAYLLNAFAPMVGWMAPYRKLSLFYLYIGADPLTRGLNPLHVAAFVVLTAAFVAGGAYLFGRRDLAV